MKGQRKTSDEARPLPYSAYPKAADVALHGIQPLPESLPLVDFARAAPHRSIRYSTVLATELTKEQLLQSAWVINEARAAITTLSPNVIGRARSKKTSSPT